MCTVTVQKITILFLNGYFHVKNVVTATQIMCTITQLTNKTSINL